MRLRLLSFTAILICSFGLEVYAQPVCYYFTPDRDNTLYENATGSLSNGAGSYLFSGRTSQAIGSIRRAVIHFNLEDRYLPGDTIAWANLEMSVSKTGPTPQLLSLHRLRADWGEGISDAPAEEGGGAAAAPDDATWLHTFYDTSFWATTGGDYDTIPSAHATVSSPGLIGWDIQTKFLEDLLDWIDHPSSNFGWIVIGDEGSAGTSVRFDSRESADPAARPLLQTINYWSYCSCPYQGDMNEDGVWDPLDLNAMISALFFGGRNPWDPFCFTYRGDIDCDSDIDPLDMNILIDLLFFGGPPPCDPCFDLDQCIGP